jgi:hypothetical protein
VPKRGRQSEVDVDRLQITLATEETAKLDRIVRVGRFGRNRNEAAARIIAAWLESNYSSELKKFLQDLRETEEFDRATSSLEVAR